MSVEPTTTQPAAPSRSRRSAPPSRRWSGRSTAARSPTSTAAPARSGCWPRSRRSTATSAASTRTSTAAPTRCRPRRRPPTRALGRPSPTTSAPPTGARSIFVRNATEAINLVARAWGDANVGEGDRIVLTEMEHHSNIVPWQQLAERAGAEIDWVPVTDDGLLDMDALGELLERGPKLVAVTHVSNVLGTENPLAEISRLAHDAGRAGARRRRPGGAEAPARRRRARGRLLRDHRPQALCADRDRRALGAARPAAGDAALPRRRLDDPQGDQGGDDLRRPARPLRGGDAGDRPGDRDGVGAALARRPRDGGGARARARDRRLRAAEAGRGRRACASSVPRAGPSAPGPSPSSSRASTPTMSPRSSTATASRSGPATTAPSR